MIEEVAQRRRNQRANAQLAAMVMASGDAIPIESRGDEEVIEAAGRDARGESVRVALVPAGTRVVNYAFDVTPARLVTGLITERGIAESASALSAMFAREARVESS